MDAAKIHELIAELDAEIMLHKEAIQALQRLLPAAKNQVTASGQMIQSDSVKAILFAASDSYVDLAVKIITSNDFRPLPMKEIVNRIRALRNDPSIERRSVEATLYRHMKMKGEYARVVKTAPGIYGVKRFTREISVA
jgi:hypothetical protein